MTATIIEPNLDAGRRQFAQITGTALSNWGMLPDASHKKGGGYHCGCQDIINIGKWATAGSLNADYSVRQERDRVGGNVCMAIDGAPDWGNGGRAAWIRHNNLLQQAMAAKDPELGALRAINYTPDGVVKRRYDTNNRAQGITPSTDTVLWHTHYEFWRNTAGTDLLRRTLNRMAQIMRLAISGGSIVPPVTAIGEDDMAILAEAPDGRLFFCIGGFSHPIVAGNIGDIKYVAGQGAYSLARNAKGNDAEWTADGWVRKGWSPAVFGPIWYPDLDKANPHQWTEARRVEAMIQDLPATKADPGYTPEPNKLHERLAALSTGGVTQDMVNAAVLAALTSPEVATALADAAFQGAQRAEKE
jgi:hypothetical protein